MEKRRNGTRRQGMLYRQFGTTDMKVSRICFGGGALADWSRYGLTRCDGVRAVEAALQAGVNFFDTSEWYGMGSSEELLGEVLRGHRDEVYIATKVGLHLHDGRGIRDSRPERIVQHIDQALSRLQTDYIDLYQIHWPDPEVPMEDSWLAMCQVQRSGKARWIGVSNYRTEEIERCLAVGPVHSLQSCFHMLRREIAEEELRFCHSNGIGVMIWGPLAHGLLTGKFTENRPPAWPTGDWRLAMPIMQGDGFRKCMVSVNELSLFAQTRGHTVMELAIAWILAQPGVATVITGARTAEQLRAQLGGASWELSAYELGQVGQILARAPSWRDLGGDDEYGGHHVIPVTLRPQLR